MNIAALTKNLQYKDGIWFAHSDEVISYPDGGNEVAYQLEDQSFWFKHRNHCILAAINNFKPNNTLVDIGGGNGYVAHFLAQQGIDICLIEPGLQGALYAKQRGLKKIICATLKNSHLPDNSIAAIGLFDVLEHIENDLDFLGQIRQKLDLGGRLFLTVPAYNVLWSVSDVLADHYRRYALKNIIDRLKQVGFAIDYATYFFTPLYFPVLFSLAIPTKLGLLKPVYQAKRYETLHGTNNSKLLYQLLDKVWAWERKQIQQQKQLPFGTSCLVVAFKK